MPDIDKNRPGDDGQKSESKKVQGSPKRDREDAWAKTSLAITIPGLLFAGPVVGFLLADFIQKRTGAGDWIILVGVLVGMISGGYETYKIIRRLS